jgi:hypothetical protein
MNRLFHALLAFGVLFFASCAPDTLITVQASPPSKMMVTKLPYDVTVETFVLRRGIPTEFDSHTAGEPIKYADPLDKAVTSAFCEFMRRANVFKSIEYTGMEKSKSFEAFLKKAGYLDKGILALCFAPIIKSEEFQMKIARKEPKPGPDLILKGNVKEFAWRETGSLWTTTFITILTLDLYPLLGGAMNWPEGEASIEIKLVDARSGELVASYERNSVKSDSLSFYGAADDTPSHQLMDAFTMVCETIANDLNRESDMIKKKMSELAALKNPPAKETEAGKTLETKKESVPPIPPEPEKPPIPGATPPVESKDAGGQKTDEKEPPKDENDGKDDEESTEPDVEGNG